MEPNNYTPLDLDNPKSKNKNWLILAIVVLAALIIGLGFIIVMRYQNAATTKIEESVIPTVVQEPSPTPELEEEVEVIDVGTDEAEFQQIQQDVDQL